MRKSRRNGIASITAILAATLLSGVPGASQARAQETVLRGARLIDGTGRPAIEDAVIVIEGGRIREVGSADSVAVPRGAKSLNLRGKTVMPLLINLHGHLGLTRNGIQVNSQSYTEENIRSQLEKYLAYGVGTVVSLGLDQDLIYKLRQGQRAGSFPGAQIFTAGRGLGVPSGHPPTLPGAEDVYRPQTPEEARAQVREVAGHHPDFVKIWVDDDFGRLPKMKPEIYRAIIDEAHRHHLRVVAHVFYLADAKALAKPASTGSDTASATRP